MRLVFLATLLGLLYNVYDAQAFTVELNQDDYSGFEGDNLEIRVRLDGQIFGYVDIRLRLMTETQFIDSGLAPAGFSLSEDAAESADYSYDGPLTHRFPATSSLRQRTDFVIDIVDDDINEITEQFIVVVEVTEIQNQEEDSEQDSDRPYATVTIRVDPDNPDRTVLNIRPETGNSIVSETTTGWALLLTITSFFPEQGLEISISTQGTSAFPASQTSDYVLTNTSVTLLPDVTNYRVFIEFVNDDIPEPLDEMFEVIFEGPSGEDRVGFDTVPPITIRDDDDMEIGFSVEDLEIREGESGMFSVFIRSPAELEIDANLQLFVKDSGTALGNERRISEEFSLTSANRMREFVIDIPENNNIDSNREREFTLAIEQRTYFGYNLILSPNELRVTIKDNDTDIEFGFINGGLSRTVNEGGAIPLTVGFLQDNLVLDQDFVLGYSVIIDTSGQFGNATSEDFESDEVQYGELSAEIRTQDITIVTKGNNELQENRNFTVLLQHTTETFNSPLVKASSDFSSITVIIQDDDIGGPNKPAVMVNSLSGQKQFEISWNISITNKRPVDSYKVEITFPKSDGVESFVVTLDISDSRVMTETHDYIVDDVDYSMANISVRVCATNRESTACSDTVHHLGVERGGGGGIGGDGDDEGISGGGIAAIIIVLLLLCCVGIPLLLLILFLCRVYCWKTYYPIIREKKYEREFEEAREAYDEEDIVL